MQRIIYLSSAPKPLFPKELAALLAVSRRNNAASRITGMLLYHDQNVLQVLEGDDPALTECFERIARDACHRNLIVLWRGAVETRSFGAWQMGFARMHGLFGDAMPGVVSLQDLASTGLEGARDPVVEKLVGMYLRGFPDIARGMPAHSPP